MSDVAQVVPSISTTLAPEPVSGSPPPTITSSSTLPDVEPQPQPELQHAALSSEPSSPVEWGRNFWVTLVDPQVQLSSTFLPSSSFLTLFYSVWNAILRLSFNRRDNLGCSGRPFRVRPRFQITKLPEVLFRILASHLHRQVNGGNYMTKQEVEYHTTTIRGQGRRHGKNQTGSSFH